MVSFNPSSCEAAFIAPDNNGLNQSLFNPGFEPVKSPALGFYSPINSNPAAEHQPQGLNHTGTERLVAFFSQCCQITVQLLASILFDTKV
jgi:hypothetical protein